MDHFAQSTEVYDTMSSYEDMDLPMMDDCSPTESTASDTIDFASAEENDEHGSDDDYGDEQERPNVDDMETIDEGQRSMAHTMLVSSTSPTTVVQQQSQGHEPTKNPALDFFARGIDVKRNMAYFEGQESGSCLYNQNFMDCLEMSIDKLRVENAKLRQNLGISSREAFASVASQYQAKNGAGFMTQSPDLREIDGETLMFLQKHWT